MRMAGFGWERTGFGWFQGGKDWFQLVSKGEGLVLVSLSAGRTGFVWEGLVSAGFVWEGLVSAGFVWEGLVSGGFGSFRFLVTTPG